jgi:hypothetical protein
VVQVVDFFSFDGEARDKPKPASEIRRFQRPGDVPGDEPKEHRAMGTFNLGGLLEPDKMQPFEKLNRRMVCAPRMRAMQLRKRGLVGAKRLICSDPTQHRWAGGKAPRRGGTGQVGVRSGVDSSMTHR